MIMKKFSLLLLLFCSLTLGHLNAQTRYYDDVFAGATTTTVVYGYNATVLGFPTIVKQPLIMDVYRPVGDTATNRPVVLYLHTGSFLPFVSPLDGSLGFNGVCGGTLKDSAVVEFCTRLAKKGYVACAVDYRLGWNPFAGTDVLRRYGIINAAYRGIQDLRSCIRFLRKNVAEDGNDYGIDPDKIVAWGQATGGYISLNAAFLDNYLKIPTANSDPGKFIWDHDGDPMTNPIPMVLESVNGNIYGTSVGINPSTGDTLCYINTPGYSSDFALCVNLGGACADTSWVDPGHVPIISFQVPQEIYAPYGEGIVLVPGLNLNVVEVQGSYLVQKLSEQYGNQAVFTDNVFYDLQAEQAAAFAASPAGFQTPYAGLFPLNQPIVSPGPPPVPETTSPWEWTSFSGNDCNTDKSKAIPYIDTIMRFYTPRACFALGLQDCVDRVLSNKEPIAKHIAVTAAPNPAAGEIRISAEETILSVQVFDNLGRLVRDVPNVGSDNYLLLRNGLTAGIYVIKASFKEGFVSKIVRFQ